MKSNQSPAKSKVSSLILSTVLAAGIAGAAVAAPGTGADMKTGMGPGSYEKAGKGGHHGGKGYHGRGHHGERGGHGGRDMNRMFRGLDLTEAQRDELFKLRHAAAPGVREQHKQIRASQKALRRMSMSGSYDEAAARQLSQSLGEATAQMAELRAKSASQMIAVLTDEQRAKLKERMEKRGKRKGRS